MSAPPFYVIQHLAFARGDELFDEQGRLVAVIYYGSEDLMAAMRQWLEDQQPRAFNAD